MGRRKKRNILVALLDEEHKLLQAVAATVDVSVVELVRVAAMHVASEILLKGDVRSLTWMYRGRGSQARRSLAARVTRVWSGVGDDSAR
jgi:hypothetical protein